tara:strand:+ start:157 stop:555 length:399 start_codon:yes stop_codon:yes gene_type:complete
MSHLTFHNTTVDINKLWYESHSELIIKVARELGSVKRSDELIEKFLGTKHKFKKCKDPNAPKKPKNGYMRFCDDMRDTIREKHKDYKIGDVMKELGKLWTECEPANKEKYNTEYKNEMENYEEKLEEYKLNC